MSMFPKICETISPIVVTDGRIINAILNVSSFNLPQNGYNAIVSNIWHDRTMLNVYILLHAVQSVKQLAHGDKTFKETKRHKVHTKRHQTCIRDKYRIVIGQCINNALQSCQHYVQVNTWKHRQSWRQRFPGSHYANN